MIKRRTRDQIVEMIANAIPDGSYVNLGFGLPIRVSEYLPKDKEIILHSENGVMAFFAELDPEQIDPDLINAGKQPITLMDGGCFMHHGDSFDIMRGGHLDISVLGAFQVAINGDLANWHTGCENAIPAVGGAMDLAVGAKSVYVCMEHNTKDGEAKILEQLSYPITGEQCVDRIYTDLCTIELVDNQAKVTEMVEGLSFEALQALTGCTLTDCTKA